MFRKPHIDVHYSPAPARVVEQMLKIAQITSGDILYDLGCGDGRIVIAAAKKHGARGVGVDLDSSLLAECRANAADAGVAHLVEFLEQDLFATDFSPASVLTLYLLDSLNVRLRPKILSQCAPGTRVVTYSFEMGEWQPDVYIPIAANGVMLWIVPANMSGRWLSRGPVGEIHIQQTFQQLAGAAMLGGEMVPIREGKVHGSEFTLTVDVPTSATPLTLTGSICGHSSSGAVLVDGKTEEWSAQRVEESWRPLETTAEK